MLSPKFITFTGIDGRTDFDRVVDISERYPVEWGILFSKRNQGQANRYPSLDVISWFLDRCENYKPHIKVKCSAHICGTYSNAIMNDGPTGVPDLVELIRGRFRRTQINVADGETLVNIADVRPERAAEFANVIGAERAIVQCRGIFPDRPEVDWLYDQSGGAGIAPKSWNAGAVGASGFVGYAGGICADNVLDVLDRIGARHPADKPFWIDMEGRIRNSDDYLDLDACEDVLRAVYG